MIVGFTISDDDVRTVLENHHVFFSDEKIEEIMSGIDDNQVQDAAFSVEFDEKEDNCEILDKQTEAAYDEIAKQLYQQEYLKKEDILKYGNPVILNAV